MPLRDETIRLYLERAGDDWRLASAARTVGGYGLVQHDDGLVAATIVELGPDATSPGEVLEAIGRVLDRREAERITEAVAGGQHPTDLERNVAAVVEVLERLPGRDNRATASIAEAAGLDFASACSALEQAERDDVVELVATTGAGDRLWRLDRRVVALDEQRRAAQDDPRGEADR
jgi:hypothetical protein